MIKLSDYVAEFVKQLGVDHVFLLPGGGNMHLADSFGKCAGLSFVCNLHEQACAFGAVAYGDLRDSLGVCLVTTGPGGTNTVTGVAAAWVESVSLLFISGQAKRADLIGDSGVRSMGQQEVDIVSVVRPITKYAVTVRDPLLIRYELEKSVYLATHGRCGPVWIDLPLDVQAAKIDPDSLRPFHPDELPPPPVAPSLADQVSTAIDWLNQSEHPVLFAGFGIRAVHAQTDFLRLARALEIPILTTWKAADLMDERDPLFAGRPGAVGQRGANFTQQNSDWLLALGARLDFPQTAFNRSNFARAARRIIVDIDPREVAKFDGIAALQVTSDAGAFISEMIRQLPRVKTGRFASWLQHAKRWQQRYPTILPEYLQQAPCVNQYALVDVLSEQLVADDVIAPGSSGPSSDIFFQAFRVKSGQRLRNFPGLGSMGFGLPGAIGACLASGRARTICVNGDGGFQLNIQELETVRRLALPIKFFVINNSGYASIYAMQKNHFAGRLVGSDPSSGLTLPDIRKLAAVYDIPTTRIDTNAELHDGVRMTLDTKGPVICEVIASLDQVVAPRATSSVRPDGTIVSRPMEDLWPYLSREALTAEMLIPLLPESLHQP